MNWWPGDIASDVADVLAVASAVGAIWSGLVAKKRGTDADIAAKAANQAAENLKREYHRRDLLPGKIEKYQFMYRELQPILSQNTDPQLVSQKLGELRGMVNGLGTYLQDDENETLKVIVDRLDLIAKEPTASSHLVVLLQNMGTLSVELEFIAGNVAWNRQS